MANNRGQLERTKESCPKASEVHAPLWDEYLTLAREPETRLDFIPGRLRTNYRASNGEKTMLVGIKKDSDPRDPNAVLNISKMNETWGMGDSYRDQERISATYGRTDAATKNRVITTDVVFGKNCDKRYVSELSGYSYPPKVDVPTFFSAKFAPSGKLTEYRRKSKDQFNMPLALCDNTK